MLHPLLENGMNYAQNTIWHNIDSDKHRVNRTKLHCVNWSNKRYASEQYMLWWCFSSIKWASPICLEIRSLVDCSPFVESSACHRTVQMPPSFLERPTQEADHNPRYEHVAIRLLEKRKEKRKRKNTKPNNAVHFACRCACFRCIWWCPFTFK